MYTCTCGLSSTGLELVNEGPPYVVERMLFIFLVSEEERLDLHHLFESDMPSILLVQGFKYTSFLFIFCELETNFLRFVFGKITFVFFICNFFPEDFAGLPQILFERWLVDGQPHVLDILRFRQSIAFGHFHATVAMVDPVSTYLLVHLFDRTAELGKLFQGCTDTLLKVLFCDVAFRAGFNIPGPKDGPHFPAPVFRRLRSHCHPVFYQLVDVAIRCASRALHAHVGCAPDEERDSMAEKPEQVGGLRGGSREGWVRRYGTMR